MRANTCACMHVRTHCVWASVLSLTWGARPLTLRCVRLAPSRARCAAGSKLQDISKTACLCEHPAMHASQQRTLHSNARCTTCLYERPATHAAQQEANCKIYRYISKTACLAPSKARCTAGSKLQVISKTACLSSRKARIWQAFSKTEWKSEKVKER